MAYQHAVNAAKSTVAFGYGSSISTEVVKLERPLIYNESYEKLD